MSVIHGYHVTPMSPDKRFSRDCESHDTHEFECIDFGKIQEIQGIFAIHSKNR